MVSDPATKALAAQQQARAKAIPIQAEAHRLSKLINDVHSEYDAISYVKEVLDPTIKEIESIFDPIVKATKASYDTARKGRDEAIDPLIEAKNLIRGELVVYHDRLEKEAQRQQKEAQQQQLQREADAVKQREQEKIFLRKQIEAQLAELPDDAPDDLIEKILRPLEELDSPVKIVQQVQVSKPVVAGGMAPQDNWKCTVTDAMAVLKQIVAGDLNLTVEFKESELTALARLCKDQKQILGLVFENKRFMRSTAK